MGSQPGIRPRVSVVMAVYNGEAFLTETLRSLLQQTFGDFEFLIVDDGSTDASPDIVESFGDPRIRLLRNGSNRGLSCSLNRGLAEARGEFIARIDADDVALPRRLDRQVAFLDAHPEVALVGSGFREIHPGGRVGPPLRYPSEHLQLRWSLLFYCPLVHSSVMWRRRPVMDEIGPYDDAFRYAMDWEYWSRIGSRFTIANQVDVLVKYRLGPHSMTETHPHITDEVARARATSFASVFGKESAEAWMPSAPSLFPIIDGWPSDTPAAAIQESLSAIQALQAAFEERMELRGPGLARFRTWMDRWIADRVLFRARKAHRRGDAEQGKMLFASARKIAPGIVASLDFGRYLGARLLGPRLEHWPPQSGRNS